MPNKLLRRILKDEQNVQDLFRWLIYKEEIPGNNFTCARGQFVSYFLNFIHNEIANVNNTRQVSHTPKSITEPKQHGADCMPIKKCLFNASENNREPILESTPKTDKTLNLDEAICMSPMSPLYNNNHSFTTPKQKNDRTICLGDFMITRKSSTKKRTSDVDSNRRTRRINPTNINQRKCAINFKDTENSYSFKEKELQQCENSVDQRKIMLQERMFINPASFDNNNVNKARIKTQLFDIQDVKVEKCRVTYKKELDVTVSIYSFIIHNNLLVNIGSELHYLLTLLLNTNMTDLTYISEDKFEPKHMFQSVHNILYFISNVLMSIKDIIATFDGWILKNIYENKNFKLFCNSNETPNINISRSLNDLNISENNGNVNFDTDTDNRGMFPSDQSFQAFRKQRDLFYDILRIWEQNHLANNWNFSLSLSGKIKTLFNLSDDSANFRHMAKLFKAQLLNSCNKENFANDTEHELSFLANIPNVNADKLHRLKTRLHTKETSCGINPLPQFPGYQDFYKEFITISMNYMFITHLKDILISNIVEMDTNNISISDYEEIDSAIDVSTKHSYVNLLTDLKLLAKFLGFVDSLPYKTCKEMSETNVELAMVVRNKTEPNFNLKLRLNQSIKNGSLIVTVPWVISYLGMLDKVSLRLLFFTDLYDTLFAIYTYCKWSKQHKPLNNNALITLSIGWLLELPQFPTENYFNWLSTRTKRNVTFTSNKLCLDRLNVVDSNILYNCCPYLEEIKKLLISNTTNKGITVKHITPLSTTYADGQEDNKIKLKLEEAFLNSQPISTRKTIDFVSERVASACIKFVCNKIVPDYKKEAVNEFKMKIKDVAKEPEILQPLIVDLASKSFDQLLRLCRKEIESIRLNKIKQSIDSLLAVDEFKGTKELCVIITNKICKERIEQWILAHMNKDIFLKIYDSTANKADVEKLTFILPSLGKTMQHNPNALSSANCVQLVRAVIWDLLKKTDVQWTVVESLISTVESSISERCDFNEIMMHTVNKLLLELLLLYLTHNGEYYQSASVKITTSFGTFWEKHLDNKTIFNRILCPRNVMLLGQSNEPKRAWSLYADLIKFLLRRRLLGYECFEEQCVAMYKQNWDQVTLEHFSTCFQDVIKSDNNKSHFNYLLSFLSDYCCNLSE